MVYRSLSVEITKIICRYGWLCLNYDIPLLDFTINVLIMQIYQQSKQSPISGTIENTFKMVTMTINKTNK